MPIKKVYIEVQFSAIPERITLSQFFLVIQTPTVQQLTEIIIHLVEYFININE